MGIADDIINGKYQSGTSAYKKKKKKDESIADQIINGTYQDGLAAPIGIETGFSDDIAPVKKQEEDDSIWDKVGYVGKSFGTGVWGGLTGLFEAGTTEVANNLDKGKDESFLGQLGDVFNATQYILNPTRALTDMAIDSTKESINILKDKDKNALEKATSIANNATTSSMNLIPGKALADETMQTVGYFAPENTSDMVMDFSNKATKPYYDVQQDLYEEGQQYGGGTQFLGETAGVVGRMIPSIATSVLTKNPQLSMAVMGTSVKGSSTTEALKKGAELDEAVKIGNTKGMIEYGTEMLFGGVNVFGKGALDDIIAKGIDRKVKNEVMNYLIQKGIGIGGEVVEETITDILNTTIDKGTVDPNASYSFKDWKDTAAVTVLSTAVINALTGGYGSASFKDNAARMKQNQAEGLQQEIAKKTEEYNNSQDAREKQIIQETINGLNEELNELTNAQQITDEKELRKQRFTTNETEVSDNQDINDFYKSVEDAEVNNTSKVHDFTSFVANVMKDKGIKVRAVNYDILVKEGKIYKDTDGKYKFIKNGVKTDQVANINAFKENGTLNINMDSSSSKVVESIVGHEIGEFIKASDEAAYNEIKQIAIELGKADGTYSEAAINKYSETYQDLTDDATDEYVNDKLGELFTNEKFVNELSKKPNLLQRIINEVKHLVKMATAGSAEARQLLSLQHKLEKKFKEVYRNTDLTKQTSIDTRYSVSKVKTDNQGRTLTKEQQEYFKDSMARDENGNLEVVYHGTNKAGFMTFNRNYNFYTSSRDIAESYTGGTETVNTQKDVEGKTYERGGIYEGYVNLKNPLIIDAHGENWSGIPLEYIGIENIEDVFKEYGSSYFKEKGKLRTSTNDIVEIIAESGNFEYDGIIFKNLADRGMYFHKRVDDLSSNVYVTFDSNQFKALDNMNPTTDKDIRYSLDTEGKMVDNKGNEVKLEAAEAGTHGTLMVIHNFNSSVTKGVLELGGFPAPSIAITNPKIVNHEQFGDVSVLFDKSTIDPADRKNEVYDRDVWSQDFPSVEYDINNADIKKYITKNLDYDYKDDIVSRAVTSYMYDSNLSDKINSRGIEQTLKDIKDDNHMKYLYKTSVEKDSNYKPEMKEKKFSNYYENKTLKRFIDNFNKTHDMSLQDFFYHYINYQDMTLSESEKAQLNNQIIDAIKPEIEGYWSKFKDRLTEEQYKKAVQEELDNAIDTYGKWYDFLMNAQAYDKNGEYQVIDRNATLENIDKHINKQAYEEWIDSTFGEMFKNVEKGIRNNKDPYTASGNRRSFKQLHDSYNLENIVKAMTQGETKGGEGGMFSGGFGTIQAKMARRFNSIEDIKAYEDRITTDEQAKAITEPLRESIRTDIEELAEYYNSKSSYFNNSFENASEAIAEFAGKSKKDIATFKKVLNGFYNFEVENIPDSLYKKIINDLNNLKDIPTDYFEAKPQRAIRLDEAEAFVVPNDMDADLKQQLRDRGINVIEYDPNIEGDRQAKINEFDDLKFSLSAQNEEIAPTGQWGTHFEDMRLQVEEAIAPLQEKIESLTEQLETVVNSNKQPTMAEEITNLMNIKETQSGSDYARAFFALRDKYGQPKLYKALNEYYKTGTVTEPNEFDNLAPTSQDIIEKQGQEAFNHITDEQAPTVDVSNMSFEDAVDSIMDSGDFEYSNTEHIPSPLDSRDIDEVGNRKVKAYQYENPEVKPYFQAEAQNMLYDLDNTIKGEKGVARDELGNMEYYGITRQTTEAIAYLKDNYGYSYEQIRQGLNKIIEDDGKENNAVSKRIEFMLDERLREGYTTSDGYPIPPNEDYINFLNEKQVTEYNKEAFNALTDADVPLEQTTINTEPKLKANEQVIPQEEKTAQNGNTEVTEGKQRKWVGTSTESEVVNREILPDDLDQTKIFYQPITNKATLGTANARLSSLGYEKSVEYFNNQFLNKKTTVEDIALGERLIQEAIKNKDTKTAGELIQNIAILGTELGQKVQALSIIQRMTPEGQLKMLEKTINRGKVKGDKAFTDIELTQEMKDKILKTYNEDGSYDQDKLNEVMDEVKQEIADKMQVTAMDKINDWRYLSMLGNPKTHIRNLVSNVAMQGTLKVKNALARTIEDIAPIENRTKTWKAASEEVTEFAQQTALEMKDVISGDSKYSETADIKAKRKLFNSKFMNWLTDGNSNLLEAEDWWFSKGAFESSFREFLTANGIETEQDIQNNPELIEKGKNYAVEQAQIATFRQYSWLANKIRDIENKNAATQIAVGAVLPFKKTPINIAKAGLSYSPLGFAKTLTYDIAQVKKGNMEASTLIDHIAQNTTGTALTLVGYMLAQAGFLNGGGDDDKEGKYDYQLGKQAYSINIGGSTFSLSWLSPVAMPLFVGANAYEQLVEGEEWNADVVLETLGQTLDPLSEMSFLSSLDSVLSSYDSGVQRFFGIGEAMVQNYVTQFVPTASSQLAATLDDTKRSTKVSGDSTMKVLEETYNKLIYKIPGLRQTLEPSTDIWGNEIKQSENLFTRAFENFIAPYARKDSIATEIDEELKDLYSQTGDNGLLPSIPYNYVNFDGEKYNMSAEEYTDYKKTYGQTANDLLEDLFRTTTYKNATSEERTDMVNDVYDYARDEAKLEYLAKEDVEYTNAKEDGEKVYKENLIKGAIENDMSVEEYKLYADDPEEYSFLKEKDYSYRRKYFDTNESLKEIDELYSEQKEGIDDEDELDALSKEKKANIVDKIVNSNLDDTEKASLYKRYYNSDTVDTIVKSAISVDDYLTYETMEFKADLNAKGNAISGSRKNKVIDYVNTLDMDIPQKAILIKSTNTFKFNDYNNTIVEYIGGLDIDYEDKVKILKDLDMTVDEEGYVYWE